MRPISHYFKQVLMKNLWILKFLGTFLASSKQSFYKVNRANGRILNRLSVIKDSVDKDLIFEQFLKLLLQTYYHQNKKRWKHVMLHWHDKVSDRLPHLPYKMAFLKSLEKYLKTIKFIVFSSKPTWNNRKRISNRFGLKIFTLIGFTNFQSWK